MIEVGVFFMLTIHQILVYDIHRKGNGKVRVDLFGSVTAFLNEPLLICYIYNLKSYTKIVIVCLLIIRKLYFKEKKNVTELSITLFYINKIVVSIFFFFLFIFGVFVYIFILNKLGVGFYLFISKQVSVRF